MLFKSRTAWAGLAMYLVNTVPVVSAVIPEKYKPLVDAVLTILIFVFHINPSQEYTTK